MEFATRECYYSTWGERVGRRIRSVSLSRLLYIACCFCIKVKTKKTKECFELVGRYPLYSRRRWASWSTPLAWTLLLYHTGGYPKNLGIWDGLRGKLLGCSSFLCPGALGTELLSVSRIHDLWIATNFLTIGPPSCLRGIFQTYTQFSLFMKTFLFSASTARLLVWSTWVFSWYGHEFDPGFLFFEFFILFLLMGSILVKINVFCTLFVVDSVWRSLYTRVRFSNFSFLYFCPWVRFH